MKKLIVAILFASAFCPTITPAPKIIEKFKKGVKERRQKIKRTWQCITAPSKHGCTEKEKKDAKKWLIGGTVAILVAALAAVGIAVSAKEIHDRKKAAKEEEAALAGKPLAQEEKRDRKELAELPKTEKDIEIEKWEKKQRSLLDYQDSLQKDLIAKKNKLEKELEAFKKVLKAKQKRLTVWWPDKFNKNETDIKKYTEAIAEVNKCKARGIWVSHMLDTGAWTPHPKRQLELYEQELQKIKKETPQATEKINIAQENVTKFKDAVNQMDQCIRIAPQYVGPMLEKNEIWFPETNLNSAKIWQKFLQNEKFRLQNEIKYNEDHIKQTQEELKTTNKELDIVQQKIKAIQKELEQ